MVVNLVAFAPNGQRKDLELPEGRHVIGRQSTAQIRVPLPTVSRQHCELMISANSVRVRDLGSSNGTYRNDDRVQEAELRAGDVLTVGTFAFVVQINGHPAHVVAPTGDSDELIETPPNGTKSPTASDSMDETVSRTGLHKGLGTPGTEDSSVFDFDFDFENDDNPQL